MKDHCTEHETRTIAIASLETSMRNFKWVFGGGMLAVLTIGLYMFGSIGTDIGFIRAGITKSTSQLAVVQNEIVHINKRLGGVE